MILQLNVVVNMNTEILDTLDTRITNHVLLMVYKESKEPIQYVISGEAYDWPDDSIPLDAVEFIEFEIPPQTDESIETDLDQQLPQMRDCVKKCEGIQYRNSTCCSERTAGFKSKWVCNTCKHISYSRSE